MFQTSFLNNHNSVVCLVYNQNEFLNSPLNSSWDTSFAIKHVFSLWDTPKGIPFDESDKVIQAVPQNKLLPLTSATPQNMLCLTTIIREIYRPNLVVIFFENICIILLACISTSPLAYLFTRKVRRKNCSGDDFCLHAVCVVFKHFFPDFK